jgi:3-deoxy-7-phosphoheptulonate synthase
MGQTYDIRVKAVLPLISPREMRVQTPMSAKAEATVLAGRETVRKIIRREDPRLMVVLGPCSVHDPEGAWEYAQRLVKVREEVADCFMIIMRTYFEKPRTTIGWKGFINDPHLNDSHDVEYSLRAARELLARVNELGLPTATEFLDPITPQYLPDFITWAAIGARTTESQSHREMASGLSMPVGFKNGTDGSLQTAIDALRSVARPHAFLGINQEGKVSVIQTMGNDSAHIVLRGGRTRTNYDAVSIHEAQEALTRANLPTALMVDCSHANSGKQPARQELVWKSLMEQACQGSESLMGVMVESYLEEGNQPIPADLSKLKYGVSVTDPCISWETTEKILREGAQMLRKSGKMRQAA